MPSAKRNKLASATFCDQARYKRSRYPLANPWLSRLPFGIIASVRLDKRQTQQRSPDHQHDYVRNPIGTRLGLQAVVVAMSSGVVPVQSDLGTWRSGQDKGSSNAFQHLRFRLLTALTIEHEYLRNAFDVRKGTDESHRLRAMTDGRRWSLVLHDIQHS